MKRISAALIATVVALTGCSASTGGATKTNKDEVVVTNCGQQKTYTKTANWLVNDGNIISMALAAGARERIVAVSSLERDESVLRAKFGNQLDGVKSVAAKYPSLENVLASKANLMVAGWNYGFNEGKGVTPDILAEHKIQSYLLTESCRQTDGKSRGTVDPWTAVRTDIGNLSKMAGTEETGKKVIADMDARLKALQAAPQAAKPPVLFVFDSAKDTIFSSGSFGGPQAIIDAAGGKNALADVPDTWTRVGWEKLVASKPDAFVFVEYPPQTYAEKIQILQTNPATKDLPAVKEKRFINLPYAMWTSGPLNIDAAEWVRHDLEQLKLVPSSDIKPQLKLPEIPGRS